MNSEFIEKYSLSELDTLAPKLYIKFKNGDEVFREINMGLNYDEILIDEIDIHIIKHRKEKILKIKNILNDRYNQV